MGEISKFQSTFEYKLIYVFRINEKSHNGCLKVGDATIKSNKSFNDFTPSCHDLNFAARERIDSYTSTAGIVYDLLYTEVAVYLVNKKIKAFRDHQVHEVLKRSGIKTKLFETNKVQNEWFVTDLQTVKNAIKAVKEGKTALNSNQISTTINPVVFRPEQSDAIKKTIARFKSDTRMLWNAKMRFGKTLSALQVVKEKGFKHTIIFTHRPVVSDGWFEDFKKIFYDRPDYFFGSKSKGRTIHDLLKNDDNFVYFASIQDLRGSDAVGGNFDKNNDIFNAEWDFVIVDEAHEGTKTDLGKKVIKALIQEESESKTYVLELSGTPFNLLMDYEQESIYTWDYIMEQEAKTTWDQYHFGDSNPYEELPRMNIYTYHLEKSLPVYIDVMDKAFNFREFFRIWTGEIKKDFKPIPKDVNIGDFVHERDINSFLDLICKKDEKTNYPFATAEYRNFFRHSLWIVPGVKEAKALSAILKSHHVFKHFSIINVAGDGDEEIDTKDALKAVKKAMTEDPDSTYTITLSCSRLTTGVTVPEWTAVLMLSGTYSTSASQYLQTIFRVQTPANINGKIKQECYVFDFAPDRTLKMIAESVQLSARAGSKNPIAELALKKFLNFCPVISIEDSNMKEYKVSELLQELKKAYAERVARNGFDDPKIYNDDLLKLTEVELKEFEDLKQIIGDSKQTKKPGEINVNNEGFNEEETQEEKDLKKKPNRDLTEEEKARLAELKEKRKNRDSAISILRAISIRMPLLVYGMDIDINTDVTIENFSDLIDETSWNEFMPKGVSKEVFKRFLKYYDKDIFVAASRRIRFIAKTADELEPTERVLKISSLFATFKNPDKETVLTPWRVVNMHLSDAIGGWDFYDTDHSDVLSDGPRFVDLGSTTENVFNSAAKVLEINSKTGLYPLYITYSIYKHKICENKDVSFEEKITIWDTVVRDNIYVICKTPMAKLITKRTLLGYRSGKTNMHAFDDLIMQLKDKPDKFIEKVSKDTFWGKGGNEIMKFNAVVGNPPYQEENTNNSRKAPVYHLFYDAAFLLSDISTLISPARFLFNAGQTPNEWNEKMLNDEHLKVVKYYENSKDVFPTVDIKGGVVVILRDKNINFGKIGTFTTNEMIGGILNKVIQKSDFIPLSTIVYPKSNYGLSDELYRDYPELKNRLTEGNTNIVDANIFEKMPEIFFDNVQNPSIHTIVHGRHMNKRVKKYIATKYLRENNQLSKYKLLITGANGTGKLGETLSTPIIAKPNECYSQTFMSIGSFETLAEANNCLKYVKTKFLRFLLSTLKITQNNPRETWAHIPLIDFKNNNQINWSLSIEEVDNQLFSFYGLSDHEIEFIKSNVQEMK